MQTIRAVLLFAALVTFIHTGQTTLISPIVPPTCNTSDHFVCPIGRIACIPQEWLCDNLPDCENAADEMNCSYIHDCPHGHMMCRTGECVEGKYKCDKEWDCQGGDDEKHCGQVVWREEQNREEDKRMEEIPAQKCEMPKFLCSSGQCLTADAVCDGVKDCPEGEDESNCASSRAMTVADSEDDIDLICKTDNIQCADKSACIPSRWVCDGENDCEDGSDELDCNGGEDMRQVHILEGSTITSCTAHNLFRCKSAFGRDVCISMNSTCNGMADCPEGDDESVLCRECQSKGCSYHCVNTPYGGICSCPEGNKLASDGLNCEEVNECVEHGHQCQQYCEDRTGGWECTCAPGYVLDKNGRSCNIDGHTEEGLLFLSLGTEIRSMPLQHAATADTSYQTVHRFDSHGFVRSIAYFHKESTLFMAAGTNRIDGELVSLRNGELTVLRENVTGIGYVACDWINGNIYFTQKHPAIRPGISVCTQDALFCRQIVAGQIADPKDTSARQSYRGLALHPAGGKMVWIETYRSTHRIMIANLDGTHVRSLVESKLNYPTGLTIDPIRNEVYFGDVEQMMIERVGLDGSDRRTVLTQGVSHPYDLSFFAGHLYWTDWGSESLRVSALSSHHHTPQILHRFTRFPYGIAINHTMYQPTPTVAPCNLMDCPWICVSVFSASGQSGLEARCLCPDGYASENGECLPLPVQQRLNGTSFVGTAYMSKMCQKTEGACLNGGSCEEVKNAYGRTEQIICRCSPPYHGDNCERFDIEQAEGERLVGSQSGGSSFWKWFLFFLLLIAIILFFAYCYISNRDFNDKVHKLGDKVQETARNLPVPSMPVAVSGLADKVKHQVNKTNWTRLSPKSRKQQSASTRIASGQQVASTNLLVDNYLSPTTYNNPLYHETVVYSTPPTSDTDSSPLLPTSSPFSTPTAHSPTTSKNQPPTVY